MFALPKFHLTNVPHNLRNDSSLMKLNLTLELNQWQPNGFIVKKGNTKIDVLFSTCFLEFGIVLCFQK
jgi:hypothetical protein